MPITQEIERISKKMATLSPNSQAYFTYSDMLKELQQMLPKANVVLHVDKGPTCEGCQWYT